MTTATTQSPVPITSRVRSFARSRRRMSILAVFGIALITGAIVYDKYPRHPLPVPIPERFPQSTLAMRSPGKLRVLFLGNSLTEYNGGLATAMEQLAASG